MSTAFSKIPISNLNRVICATEADCDSLVELVNSLGKRPHVLEVGSWTGKTAIAMAEAGAHVTCVDTWEGSDGDLTARVVSEIGSDAVFQKFMDNIGSYYPRSIAPMRCSSAYAAKVLRGKFDMIFIDAAHDYDSVKADIQAWWPKVRPGGVLAGHDMHETMGGVWRAVLETGEHETMPDSVWVRRKSCRAS